MKSMQSKHTVLTLNLPAAHLIQIQCQDSDGLLVHVCLRDCNQSPFILIWSVMYTPRHDHCCDVIDNY